MKIHDIFSKRQKRARGDVPDVYQDKHIPRELRVQAVHIIEDLWTGVSEEYALQYDHGLEDLYREIHEIFCREYGRFSLGNQYAQYEPDRHALLNFFFTTRKTEEAIDVIEVSMNVTEDFIHRYASNARQSMDSAIAALNCRFREHGVGYQYESGQIIRVDSELIHAEVVKPALSLLADPMYAGANEELLKAHAHYRAGRNKECLNECLKAFESCLKAICGKRGWVYKENDGASRLVDIVLTENLIPPFMESPFKGLKSALGGVANLRNKRSGHGQGSKVVDVPDYLAAYALHQTASNILLLARADKEMK